MKYKTQRKAYLKYPAQLPPDFIVLTPSPYSARGASNANKRKGLDYAPIALPIPDLPNMVSQQKYGNISGALNNVIASTLGNVYTGIDPANGAFDADAMVERIRQSTENMVAPVVREQGAALAGHLSGINGPMFQTLASGEITNPGIELLYSGPTLRTFAMNWTFAPKDAREAEDVHEIVRRLKQHHLPSKNDNAPGMLQVPSVFDIKIMVNGKEAEFYQKFFTCSLESIAVKQDSGGYHFTLPNGEPVLSGMSLVFREQKITTADDFSENI
jgi:hypothetical protein